MKQIIPDIAARRQFRVHLAALVLLVGAIAIPVAFVHAAALAFMISFALLGWNIVSASRIYYRHLRQMMAPPVVNPAQDTTPS